MDTNTLQMLDYFRIRDTVAGYCMSEEGAECLKTRIPLIDLEQIKILKEESHEWFNYITSSQAPALAGWPPCAYLFKKLGIDGFCFELSEVYSLGLFCKCEAQTKKALTPQEGINKKVETTRLSEIAVTLPDLSQVYNSIFRIIDETGQLRDLPELRAIRSNIRKLHNEIDTLIKSYTGDSEYKDALQSDLPALRSNRQVLAVKANFKGRIKGIIHEVSQTGQTVFIEPDDVVQRNNNLVQEEFHLLQETRTILKKLTAELGQYKADLETAHTLMLRLDCAYASARWGAETNGIYAIDCGNDLFQSPYLIKARHPLLGARAVPIDVQFHKDGNYGKGHRVLIITGPNTGGKTVTLKTIALLSLLNQSGFPVPASEGTTLPLFNDIYADIGDDQSLDESLSTFSGHMKNISRVLEKADKNTLILLDELGSGTDPQEGGAIAMAVLDELIKRESFVLVTTHHGILKNYGYTHPSCTNASVEFNTETLSPTYRILMGVPGESHALDIAKRNGLPEAITDEAQKYISNNQADISALIKGLNTKHEELAKLELEFKEKERRIQDKWRRVDLKELRLKQSEMELREQGYKRSRDFLDENRKMLENLVRELREGEVTRDKTLKVKDTIATLTSAVEKEKLAMERDEENLAAFKKSIQEREFAMENKDSTYPNSQNSSGLSAKQRRLLEKSGITALKPTDKKRQSNISDSTPLKLEAGVDVVFGSGNTKGTIVSEARKGSWIVQAGSIKLTIKEKDISIAQEQTKPSVSVEVTADDSLSSNTFNADNRVSFGQQSSDKPVFELRLLGMRYEEAIKVLERQLDLCAINNFKNFSVIHGKGNGILQQAVQDYLKNYLAVKEFHFAKPEDGGTGKTYVTLQ